MKISKDSTSFHNLFNKFQAMDSVEPKKQYKPRSVISKNVWTTKVDSSRISVNKVGKYDNL